MLDDVRVLRREVGFFSGIRLEIEQLPPVLFVLPVKPPVLPADCDQVSANRIIRLVVEPK